MSPGESTEGVILEAGLQNGDGGGAGHATFEMGAEDERVVPMPESPVRSCGFQILERSCCFKPSMVRWMPA